MYWHGQKTLFTHLAWVCGPHTAPKRATLWRCWVRIFTRFSLDAIVSRFVPMFLQVLVISFDSITLAAEHFMCQVLGATKRACVLSTEQETSFVFKSPSCKTSSQYLYPEMSGSVECVCVIKNFHCTWTGRADIYSCPACLQHQSKQITWQASREQYLADWTVLGWNDRVVEIVTGWIPHILSVLVHSSQSTQVLTNDLSVVQIMKCLADPSLEQCELA